jgi:muconate cycloisomerase
MACLDLLGKQAGVPVAAILGGVRRTEFVTKFVIPARDEEVVRRIALEAHERGAATLKVKVGIDVAGDVARVSTVKQAVPSAALTVDANEGWSEPDALRAAQQLDELGVICIEQPVARMAWRSLAAIRSAVKADIAGDESIWTEQDLLDAAAHQALDVACLYPGKFGGVRNALAAAHLANAHGLAVSVGSNMELGIGSAAMAQLLAAIPELSTTMPADLIGPLYHEHSLVIDPGFVRFDGASLPTGAGLGVELDEAAVAHYEMRLP